MHACFAYIHMRRLRESYNVTGVALASWISSYLTGRLQCVVHSGSQSSYDSIAFGVPQGSVLGPLLFVLYTADLVPLIQRHSLHCHLYADDTQVYGWCQPHDAVALQDSMSDCIDDVLQWTSSNRLQLNSSKTEYLWCAPSRRRHHIPSRDVKVGPDTMHPVESAVGERSWSLHRRQHDDDDSYQPCAFVVFQCTPTDTIHQEVPAVARTGHAGHQSRAQPVGLL